MLSAVVLRSVGGASRAWNCAVKPSTQPWAVVTWRQLTTTGTGRVGARTGGRWRTAIRRFASGESKTINVEAIPVEGAPSRTGFTGKNYY